MTAKDKALKRLRTNEALKEELRIANLRVDAADCVIELADLLNDSIGLKEEYILNASFKFEEALRIYKELIK